MTARPTRGSWQRRRAISGWVVGCSGGSQTLLEWSQDVFVGRRQGLTAARWVGAGAQCLISICRPPEYPSGFLTLICSTPFSKLASTASGLMGKDVLNTRVKEP